MFALCLPAIGNRTRSTTQRASACGRTAINTLFFVFGWGNQFPPVNLFVTSDTKRNPVIDIESQVWKLRKCFDMMRVYFGAIYSTVLACVVVSFIYRLAPARQFTTILTAFQVCGFPAFPCCCFWSRFCFAGTCSRAIDGIVMIGLKFLIAIWTQLGAWRIALGPAFLGAVFGCMQAVRFHFITARAYCADQIDLCVFHNSIIAQHKIKSKYVAVTLQRWHDMTNREPLLVAE